MKISNLLLTCAMTLSATVPAICSTPTLPTVKSSAKHKLSKVDAEYLNSLVSRANANDEKAQDEIVKLFASGEFMHFDFISNNVSEWKSLRKCEEETPLTDSYAYFILNIPGYDVVKYHPNLIDHLNRRAEAGYTEAMCNLGLAYEKGVGVPKDLKQALARYEKPAKLGLARGMHHLGILYANDDMRRDFNPQEAFRCQMLAAKKGDIRAQITLAEYYENGFSLHPDFDSAKTWYEAASAKGSVVACRNLGQMLEMQKKYSEAAKYYADGESYGDIVSILNLANLRCEGLGVEKNPSLAFKTYLQLANQGHAHAQAIVGRMYCKGIGVKQDRSESIKWLERSVEQGDSLGLYRLGLAYQYEFGVTRNFQKAESLYKAAEQKGYVDASNTLGEMYFGPYRDQAVQYNLEVNDSLAVKYFRKAAMAGNKEAQLALGHAYYLGKGVEENKSEGLRWYIMVDNENSRVIKKYLKTNERFFRLRKHFNIMTRMDEYLVKDNKQSRPMHQNASAPLNQLYHYVHMFSVFEGGMVAPILQPLCFAFKGYVDKLSILENNLEESPVMTHVFDQLQPENEDDFDAILEKQMEPAFFHSYSMDDVTYLTMGDKSVSAIQNVSQILDTTEGAFGDEESIHSIPKYLMAHAFWMAGKLLNNQSVMEKFKADAMIKQEPISIDTFGQAKACLNVLKEVHKACLRELTYNVGKYRKGLNVRDSEWLNIVDKCRSHLIDSNQLLSMKAPTGIFDPQGKLSLKAKVLKKTAIKVLPEVSVESLLEGSLLQVKTKIKEGVDYRTTLCMKDPVYKTVFKTLEEKNPVEN